MKLIDNNRYQELIKTVAGDISKYNDKLTGKSFLISGATGMIGSFLIDTLMYKNKTESLGIRVIALGRNEDKARTRFPLYFNDPHFSFKEYSLNQPDLKLDDKVDFIFHLASSTHPLQYSTDPVGTLLINIEGLKVLLDWGRKNNIRRFLFSSSVEIYGENKSGLSAFQETDMGYLDCNNMRACYSEGKRAAEALSQGYISQYGMDIVIPRLARVYGPTMLENDSKAIAQFIKKSINKENIVLKSDGSQLYSYVFVADAVTALIAVLFDGETGAAYNIADRQSDITLKDLATQIASSNNVEVVFDLPSEVERKGYSKATFATLDPTKLEKLGWEAKYTIDEGIKYTVRILEKVWGNH